MSLGFRDKGLGFRVYVKGFEFRVQNCSLGFRV